MLRVAIVAAVIAVAPPARADCGPATAYLPAPDTTVPTNAKLWSFRGAVPAISLDGVPVRLEARRASDDTTRLDPGALRPRARYTYADGSTFATAGDADHEPPPAPIVQRIAIVEAGGRVSVDLAARLAGDAAMLRVTFRAGPQRISFVTLPDGLAGIGDPACGTALPMRAGDEVEVAVSALDLAGNESDPVERDVAVQGGVTAEQRPPLDDLALILMVGGAFAGLVAFSLGGAMLADLFQRAPASPRGTGPLSLLVAERIADRTRRLGTIYALALGVAALAFVRTGAPILASLALAFAGIGVATALRAVRLSRVIAGGDATGELVGVVAVVRGRIGAASLAMSRQDLAAARDPAVPACIVYK